ncbi:peptidoglycan-binding protein [Marinobacter orientalis]|uniref:Peptidoglycan-binding protein n=2 Tax=Marinobacter orientalis TaxID=1928859 RepID=A0A7Y0RD59_9GAMM|nr:peptidoglycan-binding protein [Marinobacter orientalis]TGX49545.1 peptidoglycan-binding protein [Marinobacter orientalis]
MALAAAPHAVANDTVALKNALYGAGYDINNVTPQMDESTRSALTAFQRDQGLDASGDLNNATKEALGIVAVQVAASGSPANASASRSAGTSGSGTGSEEPAARAGQDDVEEDDDGGWSFF